MTNFFKQAQATIVSLLFFTFLLGGIYPLLTLAIAQTAFHAQAEGSLIHDGKGRVIGSRLIGQNFSEVKYLWGRLSATGPAPYNASASSGSNLGVNNPAMDAVKSRIDALNSTKPVPVDLVTASGSGLDPEISPAAAAYQISRIAAARRIDTSVVTAAIASSTKGRTFGILGEPRVNVLEVNLRLDGKLK